MWSTPTPIVRDPVSREFRPRGRADAGDEVVCPNGHVIADVTRDLRRGDIWWVSAIKFRGKAVEVGTPISECTCPVCGLNWIRGGDA